MISELKRHEFVCVVSVVCRCLGAVFEVCAVWSVFCSVSAMAMTPISSAAGGSTTDRPTALTLCHHSFQFEHRFSSFAKLMCQADVSCTSETVLGVSHLFLDLANTSIHLLAVGDHLLIGQGDDLYFPEIGRASNENQTQLDRQFETHCSKRTTCQI